MCNRCGNDVRGTRDRNRNRFVCECREVRGTRDNRRDGYDWFGGGSGSCGCGCGRRRRREREFRCFCREVD